MRSANSLQISAVFRKTMESIDSVPLVEKCRGEVVDRFGGVAGEQVTDEDSNGRRDDGKHQRDVSDAIEALVCTLAECYPFPTNLDNRPPGPGGMAPESEQDVLRRAIREQLGPAEVMDILTGLYVAIQNGLEAA